MKKTIFLLAMCLIFVSCTTEKTTKQVTPETAIPYVVSLSVEDAQRFLDSADVTGLHYIEISGEYMYVFKVTGERKLVPYEIVKTEYIDAVPGFAVCILFLVVMGIGVIVLISVID